MNSELLGPLLQHGQNQSGQARNAPEQHGPSSARMVNHDPPGKRPKADSRLAEADEQGLHGFPTIERVAL